MINFTATTGIKINVFISAALAALLCFSAPVHAFTQEAYANQNLYQQAKDNPGAFLHFENAWYAGTNVRFTY